MSHCDEIPKSAFQKALWDAVKKVEPFEFVTSIDDGPKISTRGLPDKFTLRYIVQVAVWSSSSKETKFQELVVFHDNRIKYNDDSISSLQTKVGAVRKSATFIAELVEISERIVKCRLIAEWHKPDFHSTPNTNKEKTEFQKAIILAFDRRNDKEPPKSDWAVALPDGKVISVGLLALRRSAIIYTNPTTGEDQAESFKPVEITDEGVITYNERHFRILQEKAGPIQNLTFFITELLEAVAFIASKYRKQ